MCFARPSVSAVDQYCSSNVRRRVCAHARPYQPPKRNSRLEVAQLQNSPRLYHDRNQYIRAKWNAPNAAFRVRATRTCLAVLTDASAKFGMRVA
jgi:hypothetical protein